MTLTENFKLKLLSWKSGLGSSQGNAIDPGLIRVNYCYVIDINQLRTDQNIERINRNIDRLEVETGVAQGVVFDSNEEAMENEDEDTDATTPIALTRSRRARKQCFGIDALLWTLENNPCPRKQGDAYEPEAPPSPIAPSNCSSLASTPQKSVTPSSFLSARKSSATSTPKVKPATHSYTPYELQSLSIRACLDQMSFGSPQGAITKEAMAYFASILYCH
ncbi:hypothetical protein BDR26DRAFT_938361 [Obelidium mucronatum]|nr:hypothetical protein BDR26DRAFT_938361 [Obelidium mucronatum]